MEYVLIIAAALIVLCAVCFVLSTVWLKVKHYRIKTDKLNTGGEALRIVFISDLHERTFGKNNSTLIDRITACVPDVIMIGGDVVDTYGNYGGSYEHLFHALPKIAPTYLILGNHEYSSYRDTEIKGIAENSGIHVLDDTAEEIEFQGNVINVIGLSDYKRDNIVCHSFADKIKLMPIIDFENRLNILLCHRPAELEALSEAGINVMLSGHTHGGQMRLPFVGAVFSPGTWRLFPKYAMGHYGIGNMDLVVSAGLGASVVPVRFCNRPEITVVDITQQ